jgi:hypothetical protein
MVILPYLWVVMECGGGVSGGQTTVNRKVMGGKYSGIRWKDTFRLSNLSKSKNSQNIFSGSKVALF